MFFSIGYLLAIFGQFYVGAELAYECPYLLLGVTLVLRYGLHPSHISQKSVGQIFGCYPCATRQGAFFLAATFFFGAMPRPVRVFVRMGEILLVRVRVCRRCC